jgi:oligopeptidase A
MTKTNNNPLLDFSGLPRFSDIRPEHVRPALDQLLAELRQGRETLFSEVSEFTWSSFVQPMEDMDEKLHRMWSPVSHLNAVMNNEALRATYNECLPLLSEYGTELAQDERVYSAYRQVADGEDFASLSVAQRKIVNNALRDFRLAGAELNDADKKKFKQNQTRLAELTSKFSENVLDATNAWEMVLTDKEQLAGLPEFAINMARQSAEQAGHDGWRFTLDGPSYISFMSYAEDANLRKRMYEAYLCRASDQGPDAGKWDNSPIIIEILQLKKRQAGLLGYKNYAEVSVVSKMADSVEEVKEFLEELAARSVEPARREFASLKAFAKKQYSVDEINAWDVPYYSEKQRIALHNISQEELRPYFPEQKVLDGLFEILHRLYGLTVRERKDIPTWHDTVRVFDIVAADESIRGQFYLDLYARPHKRGGAWMDDCISRKRKPDGSVQVPVAYLVCNFAAPVDGKPALFTHNEVITLFHEFGHGLHHMLTQVDYVGVSGINGVPWDAVELPSQFMENWCWEREALDLISSHFETGEPIPDSLYQRMHAAKNFQSAMQMVRQVEFALFDIRLHSDFDPFGEQTVQQLLDEVRDKVAVMKPPPFVRFQNGFTHIFGGGYAAGYYSYKWSEVLSADAFGKFEENGVFDRDTGLQFLQNILEQGGSEEPSVLFRNFRGREPTIDALLRHSGLAT